MNKKLANFWYYHKTHVIIIVIVLVCGIYLFLSQQETVKSDYDIAVISSQGCSEEQMAQIRDVFQLAGQDQNGDGIVFVNVHLYRFALGEDGQDRLAIAALDADLVGQVSGIFFVEDPDRFEALTNGIGRAADALRVRDIPLLSGCGVDDLSVLPRTNADARYSLMLNSITAAP